MGRFLALTAWMAVLSMVSVTLADEIDTTDYTCDPNLDYASPKSPGTCPEEKIQDGVCDNPNHGGDDDSCAAQDCIDCNGFCKFERGENLAKRCRLESLMLTISPLHFSFVLFSNVTQ